MRTCKNITPFNQISSFRDLTKLTLQNLEEWVQRLEMLEVQSLAVGQNAGAAGWLAEPVAGEQQSDMMEDTADKVAMAAHTHMQDKVVGDIARVAVAYPDKGSAALAASPVHFCSPQTLMVHWKLHLGMEEEHPFFEDPLMDKRSFPAEVVVEY